MRVLVISDTHGNVRAVQGLLDQMEFDMCIHLGDHNEDIHKLVFQTPTTLVSVAGNTDFKGTEEIVIEVCTCRILVCHGHRYGVKGHYKRLLQHAEELQVQVALFGHSHRPFELEKENIMLLNPGSAALPKDGEPPSVLILTCKAEKIMREWVVL